jgi:acyl-ACP thioesterase
MSYVKNEAFRIRSYEMDARGYASIQAICNYLQEIAGAHAAELGVSVTDLMAKKMTWVLSRLHVRLDAHPQWGEQLIVSTWPSDAYNLYAIRDFSLSTAQGKEIGRATSSWMIIDLVKQKPIPMPDFIHAFRLEGKMRAIEDQFDRLPRLTRIDFEKQFNVRRSDLDINQHVNNVNYVEWAVESVPPQVYEKHRLVQLEISFRAESKYGDRIIARSENNGLECLHVLLRSKDERELAIARTIWK